jgi:hypothetical protein
VAYILCTIFKAFYYTKHSFWGTETFLAAGFFGEMLMVDESETELLFEVGYESNFLGLSFLIKVFPTEINLDFSSGSFALSLSVRLMLSCFYFS